ncbi:MAG: LysR family transcriptional regulator [Cardiobacteriaceae bacterium]|nr:LysR family transcriptional regulator [Cardiobacteriaceae bacterium]
MERTDLNNIALFAAIVQAGSLSRAAEQLCLPKSRLSRRLTALETALGSKLMDRDRNGVRLNELGENFYRHAIMMLDCAEQAVGSVHNSLAEPQGLLRISVSIEIQRAYLEPYLADYLRRYPAVTVEILMDNRRINMIQDGIDLALRLGALTQEDIVARHIANITFGLYASADYLTAHPPIHEPQDLTQHTLLHKTDGVDWLLQHTANENPSITTANNQTPSTSTEKKRPYHVETKKRILANDAYLLAHLASTGAGIALLPHIGTLTTSLSRILPEWAPKPVPLHALYYKNRGFAPTVRSFIDWLIHTLPP